MIIILIKIIIIIKIINNNELSIVLITISLSLCQLGEWKIGGVEFMYPYTDPTAPIKLLDSLKRYDPPERNKPAAARKGEKWCDTLFLLPFLIFFMFYRSVDMWGMGCLIWEVYNGPLSQSMDLKTVNNVSVGLGLSINYDYSSYDLMFNVYLVQA